MSLQQVDIVKYGFSMLQVETISQCNLQCDFCAYPLRRDKINVLPEETVIKVIDSISVADNFKHICLSQFNEPLLDKRIFKFIKYAKVRKMPVMLITNGLSFDSKETISSLIDAGPDYIKVSLQVLNPLLFSRVRKTDYDFNRYKRGIFEFLSAAQNGASEITIDIACNFASLAGRLKRFLGLECGDPSVYDTVNDLRQDSLDFLGELQGYLPSCRLNAADIDDYLSEVGSNYAHEPGLSIGKNISLKIKPFIFGRRIERFYPVKTASPCISGILGVLASGNVVPCCMAYDGTFSLGNVNKVPLSIILENSLGLLRNIRVKGRDLPSACQHCLGAPTRRGVVLKKLSHALRKACIDDTQINSSKVK